MTGAMVVMRCAPFNVALAATALVFPVNRILWGERVALGADGFRILHRLWLSPQIPLAILARPLPPARLATMTIFTAAKVIACQLMTSIAVALLARSQERERPTDVLCGRDRLQVRRVTARRYPAKMIDVQTGGDGPDELLICKSVCERYARISGRLALSIPLAQRKLPYPARRRVPAILYANARSDVITDALISPARHALRRSAGMKGVDVVSGHVDAHTRPYREMAGRDVYA